MKQNKGCLYIFIVLALVIGLALASGKDEQRVEEESPAQQEEQIEPEQKEEPEEEKPAIEDEYLTEEDLPAPIPEPAVDSKLDEAYDIIKPYVDYAFAGVDGWKLTQEGDNGIVLTLHIPQTEMQFMTTSEWNSMVLDANTAASNMKQILESNGIYNIHFAIAIGDVDRDIAYFMTVDGTTMLDIVNGVNNID